MSEFQPALSRKIQTELEHARIELVTCVRACNEMNIGDDAPEEDANEFHARVDAAEKAHARFRELLDTVISNLNQS